MKINKSFLGMFLGLFLIFVFSFGVYAKNFSKEILNEKIERLITKLVLNEKSSKGSLDTKEKFEIEKKKQLILLEKNVEESKTFKEKVDVLLKKLEQSPKDSEFKEILTLAVEKLTKKFEDMYSFSKAAKSKVNKEDMEDLKKYINYLKQKNKKNSLGDDDREFIKTDVKEALEILAEEELKQNEEIKEDFNKISYADFKRWARKGWFTRFINRWEIPLSKGFAFVVIVVLILFMVKLNKNKNQIKK